MIGPLGRPWLAATLRQQCPQMTQRPCDRMNYEGSLTLAASRLARLNNESVVYVTLQRFRVRYGLSAQE